MNYKNTFTLFKDFPATQAGTTRLHFPCIFPGRALAAAAEFVQASAVNLGKTRRLQPFCFYKKIIFSLIYPDLGGFED